MTTWPAKLVRPVSDAHPITSRFGPRVHPVLKVELFHKGLDFGCPTGTEVRCVLQGTIKRSYSSTTFGHCVIVEHSGATPPLPPYPHLWTLYAHLSTRTPRVNKFLAAGDVLGLSGATGRVTGPHLHFELRRIPKFEPLLTPMDTLWFDRAWALDPLLFEG